MHPDGRIERFDEISSVSAFGPYANTADPVTRMVYAQQRMRSATLEDLYTFVADSLDMYQAYFIPDFAYDGFRGTMPYAFDLRRGAKLVNLENEVEYIIEEVVVDRNGVETGEVLLSGDQALSVTDTLVFQEDYKPVSFRRPAPRVDAGTDWENDADITRQDTPRPWTALIDFSVIREEPAALDNTARSSVRQRRPAFRQTVDGGEPTLNKVIYGQEFDAIVRFDLWGATHSQAERLVYWFYRFMDNTRWVYRANGIKDILFLRRHQDQPVGKYRHLLYHRPVDYQVRLEHLHTAQFRKLEHITLYVSKRQSSVLEAATNPVTGRPDFTGVAATVRVRDA